MSRILIYGFGPYNGFQENPSQQLISCLKRSLADDDRIVCHTFDVSYSAVETEMEKLIALHDVRVSVGFGFYPGATSLRLESIALNLVDSESPDNQGIALQRGFIKMDSPLAIFSSFDLRTLQKDLLERGVPAVISRDPGTYVCNFSYYLSSLYCRMKGAIEEPSTLFVHVPATPRIACHHNARFASLSLDVLEEGARVILSEATRHLSRKEPSMHVEAVSPF